METYEDFKGTGAEFVKFVNSTRLANKGRWYWIYQIVNGKKVKIKGYGTWLQLCKIDDVECGNCMEQTATQFKEHLTKLFT